jgi:hypothetical protein
MAVHVTLIAGLQRFDEFITLFALVNFIFCCSYVNTSAWKVASQENTFKKTVTL